MDEQTEWYKILVIFSLFWLLVICTSGLIILEHKLIELQEEHAELIQCKQENKELKEMLFESNTHLNLILSNLDEIATH